MQPKAAAMHSGIAAAVMSLALAADRTEFAAPLVGLVHDVLDIHDLEDVLDIEAVRRVFLALHDQYLLEALVVTGAVEGRSVAEAVELEVLERLDHPFRMEGSRHLAGVGVKQGLDVARV